MMRDDIATQLIGLNKQFYTLVAEDFSQTRNSSWQGWEQLRQYLGQNNQLNILDVGCGNGRLVDYLQSCKMPFAYTGVDSDKTLLSIARKKYPTAEFVEADIISDTTPLLSIQQKFDVVTLFGVLHHVPQFGRRVELIKNLSNLLRDGGMLIVSMWQFGAEERFLRKTIPFTKIGIHNEAIEKNDFLLPWSSNPKAIRYCHYVDNKEAEHLKQDISLACVDDFMADGKTGALNRYLVFKKQP